MQALKEFIFTLCLASLCAGVVLHLFPDAAAKRCMKAVAGLYILAAVLGGAQDAALIVQDTTNTIVIPQENADEGSNNTTNDNPTSAMNTTDASFESTLLTQAAESLTAQSNAYLAAQGYNATATLSLQQAEENLEITSFCITSNTEITSQQEAALTEYFKEAYGVQEITFTQANTSGG